MDVMKKELVMTRDYEIYFKEANLNHPSAQMALMNVRGTDYMALMVNYLPLIANSTKIEAHEKIK